jgi:hypothetical protein
MGVRPLRAQEGIGAERSASSPIFPIHLTSPSGFVFGGGPRRLAATIPALTRDG